MCRSNPSVWLPSNPGTMNPGTDLETDSETNPGRSSWHTIIIIMRASTRSHYADYALAGFSATWCTPRVAGGIKCTGCSARRVEKSLATKSV